MARFPIPRWIPFAVCAAALSLFVAACSSEPEGISQYDVLKPDSVFQENNTDPHSPFAREKVEQPTATPGPKQRMLGAIIPHGPKMWFFKLQGDTGAVAGVTEGFAKFIGTVRFEGGKPKWQVPDGWRQLPDNDERNAPKGQFSFPRFATILPGPNDDSLELTVTSLGNQPERQKEFILMNVNRWRRGLGLRPRRLANLYDDTTDTAEAEQTDEVKKRSMNGNTVVLVQLVGTPQKRQPGVPPFMHR